LAASIESTLHFKFEGRRLSRQFPSLLTESQLLFLLLVDGIPLFRDLLLKLPDKNILCRPRLRYSLCAHLFKVRLILGTSLSLPASVLGLQTLLDS
jgi:hypothetical protein